MNPQYNDEQSQNAKKAVATAMILDDVALALIIGGATTAGVLGSRFMNKTGSWARGFGKGKFGKGGMIALALSGSLLFGGVAQAHDIVPIGKNVSAVEKSGKLRTLTDYIAGISDTTATAKKNASDILFETAVHESQLLNHKRQVIKQGKKLVERGRARSIFMVEPKTAENLVKWASTRPKAMNLLTTTSGLTAKQLTSMTRQQLADFMMKHDHFAAALARVKYLSVPGKIPSTMEARAAYWSKWYQGTNNPVKQQQYLRDSRLIAEEVKASALSKVVAKHIEVRPTQGLVNKVLHEGKVMHKVASKTKKASRMWQILGRR